MKNLGNVTLMAIAFMLLFTAFNTCQNFASEVLKDDGFEDTGFISIAVLYFVFALVSLVSTPIVNKINKAKVSMSCGALCYSAWIASFILPSLLNEGANINRDLI